MNIAQLEKRVDAAVAKTINETTPGLSLLIAKDDEILLRKGYGMADLEGGIPVKPEDNFVIASNTKQFTCLAIMMLKEQGLLDYDETIERFFPDFPPYRKYVTIRQMMTHRSGIKEYFEEGFWQNIPDLKVADTKALLEIIKGFGDLEFEPETKYSYCNSAYVMLGNIIEQLSEMSFGTFLKKRIFEPLGMNHTYAPDYMDERGPGLVEGYKREEDGILKKQDYDMLLVGYADGNMQCNVDDLFTWHKYLYGSDSEQLVSRETLAEAFQDNMLKDGSKTGYGFGFFLGEYKGHREIWHTGGTNGHISRCSRYVDDGLTAVMLTNYEGLPKDELFFSIADELFCE